MNQTKKTRLNMDCEYGIWNFLNHRAKLAHPLIESKTKEIVLGNLEAMPRKCRESDENERTNAKRIQRDEHMHSCSVKAKTAWPPANTFEIMLNGYCHSPEHI